MREAIIKLDDEELDAIGLGEFVTATRAAGLLDVTELVCSGAGGLLQIVVEEPIPATDLERFESVEWWERLDETHHSVTYLCQVEPTAHSAEHAIDDHATAHDVSNIRERGIDLSVVGSQEEIRRSVDAIDDAGMRPLLERLSDFGGSESASIAELTARQREIIETAHAMGYYDVPRTASTEDVATEVGLDPSTVAEHLQRAERNVLDRVLSSSE